MRRLHVSVEVRPEASRELYFRREQEQLSQMPGALLPPGHERANQVGYALFRTANDFLSSLGRNTSSYNRTPVNIQFLIDWGRENFDRIMENRNNKTN